MSQIWGLLFVFSGILLFACLVTKRYSDQPGAQPGHFQVPPWVVPIPLAFGALYTASIYNSARIQYETDKLEFSLSDMSKKEFLNFKVGDDRTNTNFLASVTSSSILTGSALLGPFLRGDR